MTRDSGERGAASKDRRVGSSGLHFGSSILPLDQPGGVISELGQLLQALEFSAYKHRAQRRKGADSSPYINHPISVATILATIGDVTDLAVLQAAVLHDTLEDTETTPAELEEHFGPEVRSLVEEMSDDKRLPKAERKRLQIEHAPHSSSKAKLVKLADKIANIRDVTLSPPAGWKSSRRREYLEWADNVVAGCRGVNSSLEAYYDHCTVAARRELGLASDPLPVEHHE